MKLQYPVVIVPEESGGYYVVCPVLPGCFSQASTMDQAKANIREAIQLTVEDMLASGEALPDLDRVTSTTVSIYPEGASVAAGSSPED